MGISDYLVELTKLTNTNLQLLNALNDSLTTDSTHLSVNIDNNTLAIPSFISLENKLNTLQANFESLVNSPKTSEAYFTFNGDSRSIQVRSYENGPLPISTGIEQSGNDYIFHHESNNMFKDFLDPIPYLKINTTSLPNDITTVDVRKVVAKSEALKTRFSDLLGEDTIKNIEWGDINKILFNYEEGVDYVMYDTVHTLPIRSSKGDGVYVIKEVVSEEIDENLNQHYTIKIDTQAKGIYRDTLTYKLFDQTIEKQLKVGDILVNGEGTVKLQIEDLNFGEGMMKVWNIHNGYANLLSYNGADYDNIPTQATLSFFSNTINFDNEKYVKVPLEEDQYIFVVLAPLNSRMNIRASWGQGALINTFNLVNGDDNDESKNTFEKYYKSVTNIGDILNEISKVMSNTTTLLSQDDITTLTSSKLSDDKVLREVVKINGHLSDNVTIANIESLYQSKQNLKSQLSQVQTAITEQQNLILQTNFSDTEGIRKQAEDEITTLTKTKNELINSLNENMQAIAMAASSATIPIEKTKYRIRGFVDYEKFVSDDNIKNIVNGDNIKGIRVQYQYVNPTNDSVGKATSFKSVSGDFLFSDWNELHTFLRPKVLTDNGYSLQSDNSNSNEPSFNQFEIPITQGESVNMKFKVIYDFGYPFIQMSSDWSDVITVDFPNSLVQDVDVVDIISENNDDIETNRFENILRENGIISHIDDKISDQDRIYFHNPSNIASGFYTEDSRRIIPLADKLKDMSNSIADLLATVNNDVSEQLQVSVSYGDGSNVVLTPGGTTNIVFKDFKEFMNINPTDTGAVWDAVTDHNAQSPDTPDTDIKYKIYSSQVGGYTYYRYYKQDGNWKKRDQLAETICYITLKNVSPRSLMLFSMFPTNNDGQLYELLPNVQETTTPDYNSEEKYGHYRINDYTRVFMSVLNDQSSNNNDRYIYKDQFTNQIITFRNCNKYTSDMYYGHYEVTPVNNMNSQHYWNEYRKIFFENDLLSNTSKFSDLFPGTSIDISDIDQPFTDILLKRQYDAVGSPAADDGDDFIVGYGMSVYPLISDKSQLVMTPAEAMSRKILSPGQEIVIPLRVRYNFALGGWFDEKEKDQVEKIMSFDVRTSMYQDPTTYTMKFISGINIPDKQIVTYQSENKGIYTPSVN